MGPRGEPDDGVDLHDVLAELLESEAHGGHSRKHQESAEPPVRRVEATGTLGDDVAIVWYLFIFNNK
jgi:hypothetical protein